MNVPLGDQATVRTPRGLGITCLTLPVSTSQMRTSPASFAFQLPCGVTSHLPSGEKAGNHASVTSFSAAAGFGAAAAGLASVAGVAPAAGLGSVAGLAATPGFSLTSGLV